MDTGAVQASVQRHKVAFSILLEQLLSAVKSAWLFS